MEKALEAKPLEALPQSACLFLHKGVDNSTESSIIGSIEQRSLIGPYSALTFESDSLDLSYLDLKKSYFECRVKAQRVDKEPLGQVDFSCCNNLFHSLWADIVVSINGTQISSCAGRYPYQSLMYALMDTQQSIDTYRSLAMYKKETEGAMDERRTRLIVVPYDMPSGGRTRRSASTSGSNANSNNKGSTTSTSTTTTTTTTGNESTAGQVQAVGGTNPSMFWRTNKLASGNEISLFAKLDMDIFHIDTYLINGAAIKILFKQTSPQFRIIQPENEPPVIISVVDIIFHPHYITLSPELVLATEDLLEKKRTVIMPYTANRIDSYTIAPGTYLRLRHLQFCVLLAICVTFLPSVRPADSFKIRFC